MHFSDPLCVDVLIFLVSMTDCCAASARSFTSIQHVELPFVRDSSSTWTVHAGFMVGHDGMNIPLN